jgi:hypothetical protein
MLTFFTTGKPFRGHDGVIQRNALKSWKLLHPEVEVIVFGDEEGAAEVCAEYGLRHEPQVERFEGRIPYVNAMFARAQEITRHEYLCYANCDIVFLGDFVEAFQKAVAWRRRFLLVGQRWDTDIREPIHFERGDWAQDLRQLALREGSQQIPHYVDFFVFSKGLYKDVPALVVGYSYWDHWMMWKALSCGAPVLDGSRFMVPIHQNHSYSAESQRSKGSNTDRVSRRNYELANNGRHLRFMLDASHVISRYGKIRWSPFHRQLGNETFMKIRQVFVEKTFKLRSALGLRRQTIDKIFGHDEGG